ncbi:lytic transglycosylase domain-containing protein [Roseovarius spongiae]|uniref:Lytic transglycosylase domain-containing protein n=1 Tax=Roseovarius spongiae TaxID=2320272 RepID=A0A3A8B7E1_9RHOB|nr:lytic transglycosylase domain-containing protein [Roseovarius spongiae]RKF12511.1 lytic transglycosylase domain-containing protein [Roseovarius spongiae]
MVYTIESDGSLSPSNSQDAFARNYNDGIGQGDPDAPLNIFGSDREAETEGDDGTFRVAAVAPRIAVPRPDILAAIDETALRYAAHQGLRTSGLSVTEWRLLFRANIEIESAYNPNARSRVGAIGLGQLMPGTADILGVDASDWRANLDGSARYLAAQLETFRDTRLALAAYNAGPEAVREHGGIPPYRETQTHVQRVLAVFNRLEGENS